MPELRRLRWIAHRGSCSGTNLGGDHQGNLLGHFGVHPEMKKIEIFGVVNFVINRWVCWPQSRVEPWHGFGSRAVLLEPWAVRGWWRSNRGIETGYRITYFVAGYRVRLIHTHTDTHSIVSFICSCSCCYCCWYYMCLFFIVFDPLIHVQAFAPSYWFINLFGLINEVSRHHRLLNIIILHKRNWGINT